MRANRVCLVLTVTTLALVGPPSPSFHRHQPHLLTDLLGKPPPTSSASTLSLPSSLFSDVFADVGVVDCFEVGVVSLVYGGIGPPLSLNEDQLLEIIGCSNSTSDSQGVW